MKLSWLAQLVGINSRNAGEDSIAARLEAKVRLADAVILRANERTMSSEIRELANAARVAGEGVPQFQQVSGLGQFIGPGTNIYSPEKLGRDAETDPSKIPVGYIVVPVASRPGHYQIYVQMADGSRVKQGVEMNGQPFAQDECDKLNRKLRARAEGARTKAKANEIKTFVDHEMRTKGCDYTTAFTNTRRDRPHLFLGMADPSEAQRRQMPRRK